MQLHDVHRGINKRKKRKRIGRGIGSGHGKTSPRGTRGTRRARGSSRTPCSRAARCPLARRVPKRGFVNGAFKKDYAIVNLSSLEACYEAGAVVDEAALRARGLVKGRHDDGVKILGDGELTKPLIVHAAKFSESAAAKIAAAGRPGASSPPPDDRVRRPTDPRPGSGRGPGEIAVGKLYTILFKVPELQRKILMTAMFLAIYRIGFYIPLPIVDQSKLQKWQEMQSSSASGKVFGTVAMFGGTSIGMSTIFGLGIMPYISASIIFQLLGSVVPSLEAMRRRARAAGRRSTNTPATPRSSSASSRARSGSST